MILKSNSLDVTDSLCSFKYLVTLNNTMKKIAFILLFGIVFVSCNQEKALQEYMTKSWQTDYIKIEMPTYRSSDSTYVFEDDFKNNPPRIAQSQYKSDGTFVAWYLDPSGNRLGDAPGTWKIKGDSLMIEYEYNGRVSKVSYHIKKTEEGFEGTSKYDWDEDGENDDLLIMKTKQIELKE